MVGETVRMIECVAILRPREVPVSASETLFVIVLLAIVLSNAPAITIGIMTTHNKTRVLAKLCRQNYFHQQKHLLRDLTRQR